MKTHISQPQVSKKGRFHQQCFFENWSGVGGSWFLGCWCLSFLVSSFLGFQDSEFLGFKVSWFQVSKCQRFNDPILPNFHVMFLLDADFMSKIFKILFDGSSGFSAPSLSETNQLFRNPTFCDLQPCYCLDVLVSPEIKIIGFGAQGHVQKLPNHRNEGFWFLP